MSTAENKRSVIVGIFVFLAIVIFVAGVFILGGQQKKFVKSIVVNAVFDNVEGLKVGNNVWYSGVKIGTVRGIKFYGETQVEVTMKIEEDAQPYIRKDSKVKLDSEGLIGSKLVEIFGGSRNVPAVVNGDRIVAVPSLSTDDMMVTLQENNQNLLSITNDLKGLTAKLAGGEGTIGALLTDSTLAENFETIAANLRKASATTANASVALSRFTSKLNTEGGLANELLTDTTVFSKLKTSVSQLEKTTAAASAVTNDFKKASSQLDNKNNALGVMLNDKEFATQLKSTMENLETSSEKLDENMEALQHNFLLRGFFRRKEKRETKQAAQQNVQMQGEQQNK